MYCRLAVLIKEKDTRLSQRELSRATGLSTANDTREICDRSSENLTRLEEIVESNTRAIEAVANKLDEKFDLIGKAVIEGQDRLERLERRDKRVDAEIRGLRIETRRMLERWLGEPFTDNPDLDDDDED